MLDCEYFVAFPSRHQVCLGVCPKSIGLLCCNVLQSLSSANSPVINFNFQTEI